MVFCKKSFLYFELRLDRNFINRCDPVTKFDWMYIRGKYAEKIIDHLEDEDSSEEQD